MKRTAEVVGFRGFNMESDAFMAVLDLLQTMPSDMKKMVNKAADMILGGGAKKAMMVLEPAIMKWVISHDLKVAKAVVEDVPELELANWDAKLLKRVAKITAVGLIKDIIETPSQYRRYMDKQLASEFDRISEERGKAKFKMLLQRGGVKESSEEKVMDKNMVARELVAAAKDLMAADTFKCPDCGSKVLDQTKYCVKCKKKVKKAGEDWKRTLVPLDKIKKRREELVRDAESTAAHYLRKASEAVRQVGRQIAYEQSSVSDYTHSGVSRNVRHMDLQIPEDVLADARRESAQWRGAVSEVEKMAKKIENFSL